MKAILIDDEKHARVNLKLIIKEYLPEIEIVSECENLPEGVKAIRKTNPDLVLLDIEMPGHSGLELLDFFDEDETNFHIIFTTAYNEYAMQAFKFSAVDYLLKPINPEELLKAVKRLKKQIDKIENLKLLKANLFREKIERIAIPSANSFIFVDISDIIYIKAEGAYSEVFCKNSQKHLVSRNLKNFEDILCENENFCRVHKSFIINLNFVSAYHKSNGGSIELKNLKMDIPIATDKAYKILEKIKFIKR